jgi:hypothetical protein
MKGLENLAAAAAAATVVLVELITYTEYEYG